MQLLARHPGRTTSRFALGAVAYWGLNAALLAEEVRWHLLYRLTIWDVSAIRSLLPLHGKTGHF
jgi:hypothetical protein